MLVSFHAVDLGSERHNGFDALYAQYLPVVHGIAISHVGSSDADDVVQEVFVLVHEKRSTLRDEAALPAWICALARNCAVDHLRRRQRRPPAAELADEPPAPERGGQELAQRVLERIRTLPEAYRETLALRLVEGLTGPEIAACTGLTHGSVRVNLTRGMALLRPLLQKDGWQ
jgi:RNA polymerase sigma-70 factor (ECF subfamily)